MKLVDLEKKLIAVARANPPSDLVPPTFPKRMMALISARPVYDLWAAWARGLWYAAAPCVAVMLLFSGWAFFRVPEQNQGPSIDLAQQLDNTLLAAVDQNTDSSW
jgi:tellurite resistance protein TehA-like permease